MKIDSWLDKVNDIDRELFPISSLSIALQCGGSDAFSGMNNIASSHQISQKYKISTQYRRLTKREIINLIREE
jgi:altronate dehydratase